MRTYITQELAKHAIILLLSASIDIHMSYLHPSPTFIHSTMPLLWRCTTVLFDAGLFVTIATILQSAFAFQDLYSSTLLAQRSVRESCIGFITNNAPMLTSLFVMHAQGQSSGHG